jgi:spore coat polysaccharide biosynthesis protein SpsF
MNPLKIIAIIQARMSSSRLPDKVLLDIAGQPMLSRVYQRTRQAELIDEVVVATSTNPADDPIQILCETCSFPFFRGSEFDVLDRYYQASRLHQAGIIVRITADCPVIDPGVINHTIRSFLGRDSKDSTVTLPYDFAANRLPPPWHRTYPIGLDTEVCTFDALQTAWTEALESHQREHVMPFFYEQPERFRILHVTHDPDYGSLRWTVDTPQDLEFIRRVYDHLPDQDHFSWLDILDLSKQHPELVQINMKVQHKHYQDIDRRMNAESKDRSTNPQC